MHMKKQRSIWGLGVVCLLATGVCAHTFTDVKHRKIEAEITQVFDDEVELKMSKNGKLYKVPFAKLSAADNQYIKDWQERQKKESEKAGEKTEENKSSDDSAEVVIRRSRRGGAAELKKKYDLKDNFDDPWPDLVKSDINPEIDRSTDQGSSNRFIYLSPNYEFISDVELSKNVVKKFAVLFEATRNYCKELPIATMKAHVPGEKFRNKILLFETKETYIQNGGPPESAGVFIGRKGVVMAPLESIGVKKVGSSYMFDYKGSNQVLPHEITHQLTDEEYYASGAMGWFSEGLAEYVANTPYRSGKFMVKTNLSAIKAYATEYGKKDRGGRALGDKISAPDLKTYMLQPYPSFVANANLNYGLGMMITYYFFHWDGEGDRANINAFLKVLKEGKEGEEALDVLLNGRSWDDLEKAISKAWRSRGVRITFS